MSETVSDLLYQQVPSDLYDVVVHVPQIADRRWIVRRPRCKSSVYFTVRVKKSISLLPCRGFTQLPECSITMTAASTNEIKENTSEQPALHLHVYTYYSTDIYSSLLADIATTTRELRRTLHRLK